jgi:hypothetical protein
MLDQLFQGVFLLPAQFSVPTFGFEFAVAIVHSSAVKSADS